MKYFIYILMLIAAGLVIYNVTQINFEAPLEKGSIEALITSIAGLCAIMLLAILTISKKIEQKVKQKR